MRKLRSLAGLLLSLIVVIAITSVEALYAQSGQKMQAPPKSALAISPPTFELSANPGDTLKNSIRVDNIAAEPLEIAVDRRNFTALGEEGGINLSDEEGKYSLANWIEVTPDKAALQPGESKTFEYTIKVPAFAEPGGRFGSIIFKTAAKQINSGQSGVAVAQEIGALIFIKISGEVKEKAAITDFAPRRGFYENGPVDFDLKVKNEGNVQFKPSGTITISNSLGQKVATIPVDAQNVLPDATRKMAATWKNEWLLGQYTATLSLTYGNGKQILTASTTFWAFPYKPVLAVIIIGGVLGWFIFRRRQRIGRALKVLFGRD